MTKIGMKKLASIQKIHSIQKHPNADTLSIAKVLQWPIVIKTGDFVENELIVFIQIDSIVPENETFEFMRKNNFRVWNAKFKKCSSQGLVMPLSILSAGDYKEGDDVTEILGVIKFEKPEPIVAEAVGHFPTHIIPITDEDNLLNNPDVMKEFVGEEVYLTGKADGSSCTVILKDGQFKVCSRRLEQKKGTGFWAIIDSLKIEQNLRRLDYDNIALQMEVVGPGIQNNRMGLKERSVRVFNVRSIGTGDWYSWDSIKTICNSLEIPTVEFIARWKFEKTTIDELQNTANGYVYGQQPGEGIVLRPIIPKFSSILGRQLSVKILNINYKQ